MSSVHDFDSLKTTLFSLLLLLFVGLGHGCRILIPHLDLWSYKEMNKSRRAMESLLCPNNLDKLYCLSYCFNLFEQGACPACKKQFVGYKNQVVRCTGCRNIVWQPQGDFFSRGSGGNTRRKSDPDIIDVEFEEKWVQNPPSYALWIVLWRFNRSYRTLRRQARVKEIQ